MKTWNENTGYYEPPSTDRKIEDPLPPGAPENWLSKPGGDYYLCMSFHFAPYSFPQGQGTIRKNFQYRPTPYFLRFTNDPYNSWGVFLRDSKLGKSVEEYWDWLPGILIVDTSKKYTLPHPDLSTFAGTEWTDYDNEPRVFHGFYDQKQYESLINIFLFLINKLTGPGWPGWPFGIRQLSEALFGWIRPNESLPDILLLASTRQSGAKFRWGGKLYDSNQEIGKWCKKPSAWDYRPGLSFFYQAQLMLDDGFPEIALSTAIASLENVIAEVLLYHLGGNIAKFKSELKKHTFLKRINKLLPSYGVHLPSTKFETIKRAYKVRNEVVHGLQSVDLKAARNHIKNVEKAIQWYLKQE